MSPFDTIGMAMSAITRNKARSSLTTLGIVIGVASVIAMVHLGQSATESVTSKIANMGTNLLIVHPSGGFRGRGGPRPKPFSARELAAMQELENAVVAPVATSSQTVIYNSANSTISIVGTTSDYLEVRNWALESGRIFNDKEERAGSAVCLIGSTLHEELFSNGDPLGEILRVGQSACQIIGVLESKGESMGQDQDEVVMMPLKAVQRRLKGEMTVDSVYISATESTSQTKSEIETLLRELRGVGAGEEDNFDVRDMEELSSTLESATSTLTALLGAIAAVSLLVGGIGIMNIMLVSVTERTREIGVRLAIGARATDVLMQFLVESVALSCMGGLLGVGLGLAGTWFATQALNMPFVLSPEIIAVGFGFSAAIGVVFGYFPARKAARLNPIESLRHE